MTLVHFGEGFDRTVKAWVLPDITNRVKEGSIAVRWRSRVRAITPTEVELVSEAGGPVECLPCDAVLAMTGYHADTTLLRRLGVPVDEATGVPAHDERTMGTPVEGVYLAGVIASGNDANRLFIENARGHGELIVERHRRAAPVQRAARQPDGGGIAREQSALPVRSLALRTKRQAISWRAMRSSHRRIISMNVRGHRGVELRAGPAPGCRSSASVDDQASR